MYKTNTPLTVISDFFQIRVFEVSVRLIGFSVLNREIPNDIGRVEKYANEKVGNGENYAHQKMMAVKIFSFLHNVFYPFNPLLHRYSFWLNNNRQLLKTLWEKEKLLVMSNFSFSHNVFYSIRLLYPHLSVFLTS